MPAICRHEARSRSISHEHSRKNAGMDELISTALTAVVLRKPR